MLRSDEQFVVVANVLIVAAHNQIIVGCLRRSALQLRGTRVAYPERDSCQASDIRTTPTRESVLRAGCARSRVPDPK